MRGLTALHIRYRLLGRVAASSRPRAEPTLGREIRNFTRRSAAILVHSRLNDDFANQADGAVP
jgi:hypothetical protein